MAAKLSDTCVLYECGCSARDFGSAFGNVAAQPPAVAVELPTASGTAVSVDDPQRERDVDLDVVSDQGDCPSPVRLPPIRIWDVKTSVPSLANGSSIQDAAMIFSPKRLGNSYKQPFALLNP